MSLTHIPRLPLFVCICLFAGSAIENAFGAEDAKGSVGTFDAHRDIGTVLHAGSASFDADRKAYTLTGSGQNMWATADAFHFVYSKVDGGGDMSIAADVSFLGTIAESGRRKTLMFNGYQELVAGLYAGIDLRKSF